MMKEKVYFIRVREQEDDRVLAERLESLLESRGLLSMIDAGDMVAVKTHFGETGELGYPRPDYFRMLSKLIKGRKALPFLTETSTLYKGNRTNAVLHLEHAERQGFGYQATGMPIIMADGLYGDEEAEVKIPGRLFDTVKLASIAVKAQAMVVVSHFTGHLATGFGAALKNMGMGCASRKGKMSQHSTAKPKIKAKKCVKCGDCVEWCPESAISMTESHAVIDSIKCIGCGQCLAVCRFDAVVYNWGVTYEDLQKKVVEHALGVAVSKKGKLLCVNILTRISRDCDCMGGFQQIVPDIGIVVSLDPVAADAASLDLVERAAGRALSSIAYDIPYRIQLQYAAEIGFGSVGYELIET